MGQSKRARRKARRIRAAAAPARIQGWRAPVQIGALARPGEGDGKRRFRIALYTGEPLDLWCFKHPVVIDCATLDLTSQDIPALLDHMAFEGGLVGQVETVAVGEGGVPPITVAGYFTPTDDPRDPAKFVLAKADAGQKWQASIGADIGSLDEVKAGEVVQVNGRSYTGPVLVARGTIPREASFVVLGADRHARAVLARRTVKGIAMDFDQFVQSMGFAPGDLDETQTANMQVLFNEKYPEGGEEPAAAAEEETPPPEEPSAAAAEGEEMPEEEAPTNAGAKKPKVQGKKKVDPVADHNRAISANLRRVDEINRICAQHGNPEIEVTVRGQRQKTKLAAHAIAENWGVQRVALEALRQGRGSGPGLVSKSHDKDCTLQALQGAMVLRAGGKLDHKAYQTPGGRALLGKVAPWLTKPINDADRSRYMEAAHHYSQMSMFDVARESVRISGRDVPHDRDDMIRAAFSGGGSLSNIFTTNVNAILIATFMEAPDSTVGWVQEADVPDYKTNERPRVKVGEGLKKVPRNAEADHTSFGDLVESYKIARFGRQFQIDDMDFVDDSFGVFSDTPKAFGQAAARLRPDLVYGAIILANPTLSATSLALFSDSNDNVHGTKPLTAANLSSGLAMMRLFRENSVNLNLQATHLLVPPTLEDTAVELTASPNIVVAAAGVTDAVTVRGNVNSLNRHGLAVIPEARLENGVVNPNDDTSQSGSAANWFLVCANGPTIEVGYLQGTGRAPRVRTTVLDKGKWGINWDVELSIGVKALEWRTFVKATG